MLLGAGKTRSNAHGPIFLDIPLTSEKQKPVSTNITIFRSSTSVRIGFLPSSDHPADWCSIPSFHFIGHNDLSSVYDQLKPLINIARLNSDLVIFFYSLGSKLSMDTR